jgi:hypothetical protein|tara:strand:+ start:455 stop:964 length:510 start_codon:yes stop_codon:yes gene_type:complete
MALSKIDVANMLTGATPVANGGTGLTSMAGFVRQVVSVNGSTADAKTATSYADITGMSLAITPTATSSKILIIAKVNVLVTGGGGDVGARVQPLRGSTVLASNYSELYISDAGSADPGTIGELKINYLDSPNTTSETTYKLQGAVPSGGTATFQFDSKFSTLTLMEILG